MPELPPLPDFQPPAEPRRRTRQPSGGLGSSLPSDDPILRGQSSPPPDVYPMPIDDGIADEILELRHIVDHMEQRQANQYAALAAVVEQLQHQVPLLEAALTEHRNAIVTLGQRLDLMARQQQQVSQRVQGAQLAVQARDIAETPDKLIELAERWVAFLKADPVTSEPAQAELSAEPTKH